jgi:excinuclease UvrABC helicase subunit UvrB
MENFGFNGMDDEDFKREFIKFLNMYQSSLDSFMKKNYNNNSFMNNPFFGITPISEEDLRNISNSFNFKEGDDFFKKFIHNNPFGEPSDTKKNETEIDTLTLLDEKLKLAIINEKYEDASKIRDLIINLKEDQKKENDKKK